MSFILTQISCLTRRINYSFPKFKFKDSTLHSFYWTVYNYHCWCRMRNIHTLAPPQTTYYHLYYCSKLDSGLRRRRRRRYLSKASCCLLMMSLIYLCSWVGWWLQIAFCVGDMKAHKAMTDISFKGTKRAIHDTWIICPTNPRKSYVHIYIYTYIKEKRNKNTNLFTLFPQCITFLSWLHVTFRNATTAVNPVENTWKSSKKKKKKCQCQYKQILMVLNSNN